MTLQVKYTDNIEYRIDGKDLRIDCSNYAEALQKSAELNCIHFINLRVSSQDGLFAHSMSVAKYNPLKGFEVIRDVKFEFNS